MGNQEYKAARENAEDLEEPPDELRNLWPLGWLNASVRRAAPLAVQCSRLKKGRNFSVRSRL